MGGGTLREVRPGRRLWVEKATGSESGALVARNWLALLVHGACAHSRQWRAQQESLLDVGLDVLSFDALGCGDSEKPYEWAAYHPEQLYKDLQAIFRAESQGYDGVILGGHSFGAALVLRLAAETQEGLAGLLLIGTYVPAEIIVKPHFFSLARWLFYLPNWVLAWMQPGLTENFLAAAFSSSTRDSNAALVDSERRRSNANPPHMFKPFYRQLFSFGSHNEFLQWTALAPVPVAVIYGDADRITPPLPNSSVLMRQLARAELSIIKDAGHQVMQEQPKEVNAVLMRWLQHL